MERSQIMPVCSIQYQLKDAVYVFTANKYVVGFGCYVQNNYIVVGEREPLCLLRCLIYWRVTEPAIIHNCLTIKQLNYGVNYT